MSAYQSFSAIRLLNSAKTFASKLVTTPTANRVITFQDKSYTVAATDDVIAVSTGGTGSTTAPTAQDALDVKSKADYGHTFLLMG